MEALFTFMSLFCVLVDFVLDQRGVSPLQAYDKWRAWADEKVCCDYAFHVGITWWSEEVAKDMEVLVKEKGEVIFYIIVFISYCFLSVCAEQKHC